MPNLWLNALLRFAPNWRLNALGTDASPFTKLDWGRCTQKNINGNTRLYLHVFNWPDDGQLIVPGIYNIPLQSYLLSDKNKHHLYFKRNGEAIVITIPPAAPDSINSVVVLDVEGKADVNNPPQIVFENNIFINRVNFKLKSDRQNIELRYTTDGSTPDSNSLLFSAPVLLTETSIVSARCFRDGKPVSGTSKEIFTKVQPEHSINIENAVNGILYKYFEGDWDSIPDFDTVKVLDEKIIPNFSIMPAKSADHFGFEYNGYIKIPEDGVYTFYTASDDGSRLYIEKKLIVDNDGQHAIVEKSGIVPLSKGYHPIRVTFFENSGGQNLSVMLKSQDMGKQTIPDSMLFVQNNIKK